VRLPSNLEPSTAEPFGAIAIGANIPAFDPQLADGTGQLDHAFLARQEVDDVVRERHPAGLVRRPRVLDHDPERRDRADIRK
jgi:hypothetical protein